MSKRTLQMKRRRDRILDAARELISDQGYEHLTMRTLAEASGVTVPTIYNLIGNKDAVLGAIFRFVESVIEVGVELTLVIPFQTDFQISAGVPIRIHVGDVMAIDTGSNSAMRRAIL